MEQDVQRNIGKTLVVYLGSAWVFIEALNFLIDKYNWHSEVLDVLILLVIFGLPAVIIYAWFYQNFTRKAIILQLINGLLAISVITYKYINPDSFKTEELRLLRFKDDQKKLARAIRSIAILPFDNYTGDDNQIHILLGLHDALISELGQLGAIRVISKTSSMAYAGSQKTIKEIASELEVDGIIEASVFRLDESIEIQLKLINAFPTEQQLWSKTYNSDISSTLNLYSEVVKNIAKEIHLTLSPEEEKRLTEPRSVHPEAYRAYLKSQYLYDSFNPADFSVALQYLDSALVFDPNYLNAHLGIAQIWIGRAQMGLVPYVEAYPIIKAAEQKAIELNIESAELHIILATIRAYEEWNWEQGLVELKRALDLNPNSSDARTNYSYLLAMLDNHDEAKIQIDLALELDPFNPFIESFYGWNMLYARQYQSAIEHCKKSIELEPSMWVAQDALRQAYHLLGMQNEALSITKELYKDQGMHEIVEAIEKGYQFDGYLEAFRQAADALTNYSKTAFVSPESIAEMYAYAKNKEMALEWLERAYTIHDPEMHYLAVVPIYDFIRGEPRFQKLLQQLKL